MKDYPIEPKLKKLNDKLSANTTGHSNIEKSPINFVDQETLVHGSSITVKVRRPESSSKAVKNKDESAPLRRTRPQNSLRVEFKDKNDTTGVKKAFYPDVVESSPSESKSAAASSSSAHKDTAKVESRPYKCAGAQKAVREHNG